MSQEIAKKGKDYSQLSKDDLIKIVEKMESRKKYGLIWDEEKVKEQFEKDAVNALPVLKEVKGKAFTYSISTGKLGKKRGMGPNSNSLRNDLNHYNCLTHI